MKLPKERRSFPETSATHLIAAGWCMVMGCSCLSPQQVYVTDTPPAAWWRTAEVVVPNTDTVTPRDFTLILRTNTSLESDTLTLRIELEAPDSLRYEELFTLRMDRTLRAAAIRPLTERLYRTKAILCDTGRYRFHITPTHSVRGIEAVGIRITPHDNQ